MKTLILGIGRQGARILERLIENNYENIHIYDINYGLLEDQEKRFKKYDVAIVSVDLFTISQKKRIDFLEQFDYIIDALPANLSYIILAAAVQTGAAIVSISFLVEDYLKLHQTAMENNSLLVPDCGAAPGLSHMLAGYSVKRFGGAESVTMKLGAVPLEPQPPFYHNIAWSVDDLLQEYIRSARIREKGKITTVDPFDWIEIERIFDIQLESFISDGVRSFLTSFPDVPEVVERTLRHPGHLDFMKNLQALNLLSCKPVKYDHMDIVPCQFLAQLIEQNFSILPSEDYFIMEIVVRGKGGKTDSHYYFIEYDHKRGISALVTAVAVTAVEVLNLIRSGIINKKGVYPLELLADEPVYTALIQAHKKSAAKYELIEE